MQEQKYCKRLIEVDLPIKRISEHARKEQNIRKGHLHSMHVWWATRPLAACRAVLMASILPDPVDKNCDTKFCQEAQKILNIFSGKDLSNPLILREELLNFIANFSDWQKSSDRTFLEVAKKLIHAIHPDENPLVIDPFAGGGSIPFEAARLGLAPYAGDLNPIPILINKVALEYLPKYREKLVDAVAKWGKWIYENAKKELEQFYPKEPDGSIPLVYIWARTIKCEGPNCGVEIPLQGLLWLSKKEKNLAALKYKSDKQTKEITFEIFKPKSEKELQPPIVKRFSVTCPVCGYTTPYKSVRGQIQEKNGGTSDARLVAVINLKSNGERIFRPSSSRDEKVVEYSYNLLKENSLKDNHLIPKELLPPDGTLGFRINKYGTRRSNHRN